ncbi:MAG TPA: FAD-dependent oxidoreductase [Bryobacteraceae bacterium]|nr:FAD-dependent oxidoreductase [Bryobacteraceae bacterium]
MTELGHRVVVVGGGVIGLTAAAALLARAPHVSVTVLERAAAGEGASAYAGAMDIPYFRNAFQRDLVRASWGWHEARGDGATEYRRMVPMTWFAESDLELQSSIMAPLIAAPLAAPPGWHAAAGMCSLRSPSFVIDPSAWCRALVRELVQSGRAEVIEKAEVIALEAEPRGPVRVNCTGGRSHIADHVVLALGPWLPGWNERTRAWVSSIGLRTKHVFGLNVELSSAADPGIAVGWPAADIYFHPAPALFHPAPTALSGRAYRLSLRYDEWDVDPDAEHPMADAVLERAGTFLDRLLGPGAWSVVGQRVFVDSYTPDFQAFVGSCGTLGQDVTIATGTHGSGVRMAPGIAELVARAVLDRLTQIEVAA